MGLFNINEDIQKSFNGLNIALANNHKQLMDGQRRLLNEIEDLKDRIAQLERKIENMSAPQIPIQPQQPYYDAPIMSDPYSNGISIDSPTQNNMPPQMEVNSTPEPFYAIYQNNYLQPIEDSLREHAQYYVIPTDATSARVEFNRDCIGTYIQNAYTSMTEAFDCDTSYTKNPRDLQAQNTSTAHMEDGAWVLDQKIKLLFV